MNAPNGFAYFPDFLDEEESREILSYLKGLDFQHDHFRGTRLKRGYVQFGYTYMTTGRKVKPAQPMPELIASLAGKGRQHCPEGTEFNQCIMTWYPPKAGIGWHTDAAVFGECIMALSLGSPATVSFRENGAELPSFEFRAQPRSLYVFHGQARWDYQHCVAPVSRTRYCLTFRFVDLHP